MVWVPEPKDGFVLATIVDLGMDEVTVQPTGTSKPRFSLPLDRVYTADPHFDDKDVDDNCKHMVILVNVVNAPITKGTAIKNNCTFD